MPADLQQRVHEEVQQTKRRSSWSVNRILQGLGISRASYYRWLREESWAKERKQAVKFVQPYEALPAEKEAVKQYALEHPEIRHRELAWRMIDEDVAFVSSSTVYRILREERLIRSHRGRTKRYRQEEEKAQRPDERWGTDLMYLKVGGVTYYLIAFLDEYSRYIVHWELLTSMDGESVSIAAQAALEKSQPAQEGRMPVRPEIRSDNGSAYISKEFHGVLEHHGLSHHKITPHCPEENGIVERANRTLREALEMEELTNRYQAEDALTRIVNWYNQERLHSSLGYLRPIDYYRGHPEQLHETRRHKLSAARHRRKETNIKLRQRTLPLESSKAVTSN